MKYHLLAYICFCLIYLLNQILPFTTLYFAFLADLNKGVVSVIWGLNPLFIAIIDAVIFKSTLSYRHLFAFLTLIICTLSIGFSKQIEPVLVQFFDIYTNPDEI
jgi:threonine/homoserine efflux transporter RhtA